MLARERGGQTGLGWEIVDIVFFPNVAVDMIQCV